MKYWLGIIGVIIGLFFIINPSWQRARNAHKEALTIGTVSALSAALHEEMQKGDIYPLLEINDSFAEWRQITESQYDKLILKLSTDYYLDPPKRWKKNMPLLDLWGKRFIILIKYEDSILESKVISKGPDGLLGTSDDIIGGNKTKIFLNK